jgi:acyl carrier protein
MGSKSSEQAFNIVRSILEETFKLDNSLIKKESLLKDDLGLDSVDLLDAVGLAEKKTGVKILENGSLRTNWPLTVESLVQIIEARLKDQ